MSEQKKYKLTRNTKDYFGKTLYQIEALISFGNVGKGELGGYIEKEENLAQVSGNAWVYGNAQVSGNAWVSGNAQVYGDAWVSGNARVSGNAQVYGDAWVYGDLKILAGFFFGLRYKKEEIKYKEVDSDYEVIYKGEAKFDETPDEPSLKGKSVEVTLDGKKYTAVIQ